MKVIFHGHACFEIQSNEGRIIIDPFLRNNPHAISKPEDFKHLDGILISHGHSDHLGDALELAKNTGAVIVTNFELGGYLERFGVQVHQMHIGGKHSFPFGTIKLTQALHGSGIPMSDGTFLYGGLACGFLIGIEDKWLYHAGDTGLFGDMQLIGQHYELELAMLPIGDNFVMGPEDAILATKMLRPKYIIPMHYNTFPLIEQDENAFMALIQKQVPESKGIILQAGDTYKI